MESYYILKQLNEKNFFIFALLSLNNLFAQLASSEGTSQFQDEIEMLLIRSSKEKIKEIYIKGNSYWDRGSKKAMCIDDSKFQFINDSILKQREQKETYHFKIKNNTINELDYDKGMEIGYLWTDSLNYKIKKSLSLYNTDTVFFTYRCKYDEYHRLLEISVNCKGSKENCLPNLTTYLYVGDTIKDTQYFTLENNKLYLKYEEKQVTYYYASSYQQKINYIVSYQKDFKTNNWIKNRVVTYFYDQKKTNRVIRIEKKDFYENSLEWYQKHILDIRYKEK